MSIILNERRAAEEVLAGRELGRSPTEALIHVAKYYFSEGMKKKDVRNRLEAFLLQCDPGASVVLWSDKLDYVVKYASKYPLVQIDGVPITAAELSAIREIKEAQAARLAFTLLCAAKYWDLVNPANDHWVNEKDTDLMRMANIRTSVRRQSKMYTDLRDAGLIRFSVRVDNLNVQVLFADGDGPAEFFVSDYRNLGNQYLKYTGKPYISCARCGLTVKGHEGPGKPKKYCDACAAKMKLEQSVNSVMRMRTAGGKG